MKVEVDGKEFEIRELTFKQKSEIESKSMKAKILPNGRMIPEIDTYEMKILTVAYGTGLSREEVENLPASVGDKLFQLISELNTPDKKKEMNGE